MPMLSNSTNHTAYYAFFAQTVVVESVSTLFFFQYNIVPLLRSQEEWITARTENEV